MHTGVREWAPIKIGSGREKLAVDCFVGRGSLGRDGQSREKHGGPFRTIGGPLAVGNGRRCTGN